MTKIDKRKFNGAKVNPLKQEILQDALERILNGDTLQKIASDHKITSRTLHTWLMSLGEEYQEIRSAYVDNMLADSLVALEASEDQFQLAHARERFKAAAWVAERRDKRYSPKQDVSITSTSISITSALEQARSRVIEGQASTVEDVQLLDNQADQ